MSRCPARNERGSHSNRSSVSARRPVRRAGPRRSSSPSCGSGDTASGWRRGRRAFRSSRTARVEPRSRTGVRRVTTPDSRAARWVPVSDARSTARVDPGGRRPRGGRSPRTHEATGSRELGATARPYCSRRQHCARGRRHRGSGARRLPLGHGGDCGRRGRRGRSALVAGHARLERRRPSVLVDGRGALRVVPRLHGRVDPEQPAGYGGKGGCLPAARARGVGRAAGCRRRSQSEWWERCRLGNCV